MPGISILLVGDTDWAEFREARAVLRDLGEVTAAPDVDRAAALLAEGQPAADVIVMVQAFPGQFSAEAVDRLRRAAPLARVVALLGSWCEGETRSGRPWPAAIRVYWHQWGPRASQELTRLRDGGYSSWGLPLTAGEEERFLAVGRQPLGRREGLIVIHTGSFDVQDWMSAACRRSGYSTVWLRPGRRGRVDGAKAVLFDASDCRGGELDELKRTADAFRPAPTLALMHFPRVEDREQVLAAGAAAVLSKPLLLEDLFWEIDRAVGSVG